MNKLLYHATLHDKTQIENHFFNNKPFYTIYKSFHLTRSCIMQTKKMPLRRDI